MPDMTPDPTPDRPGLYPRADIRVENRLGAGGIHFPVPTPVMYWGSL